MSYSLLKTKSNFGAVNFNVTNIEKILSRTSIVADKGKFLRIHNFESQTHRFYNPIGTARRFRSAVVEANVRIDAT